jgi:hypothetical protein
MSFLEFTIGHDKIAIFHGQHGKEWEVQIDAKRAQKI